MDGFLTDWLTWLGGRPCFSVYGKARPEADWRVISVFATERRDCDSRWPLWRGCCITWTSSVIVVGRDFARKLLLEQATAPASREKPVVVAGGRMRDPACRAAVGASPSPSASEIMAHECGHTWQALRLGPAYLPIVGTVTLFREGPRPWNRFENEASELGRFGGVVEGTVTDGFGS